MCQEKSQERAIICNVGFIDIRFKLNFLKPILTIPFLYPPAKLHLAWKLTYLFLQPRTFSLNGSHKNISHIPRRVLRLWLTKPLLCASTVTPHEEIDSSYQHMLQFTRLRKWEPLLNIHCRKGGLLLVKHEDKIWGCWHSACLNLSLGNGSLLGTHYVMIISSSIQLIHFLFHPVPLVPLWPQGSTDIPGSL